jgi:glyoxylase-like metal-dependent hydrolase (beta-lactamase superfamily II)
MQAYQVAPGLWRWTGWHAEWKHEVGCVYFETEQQVCVFDPLVPPEDATRFWAALDRDVQLVAGPVNVLLTVFFHARSTRELVERYGARLWAPARGRAAVERRAGAVTDPFRPGDPLPAGVEAFGAGRGSEVVYWIPEHRALIAGDVLLGGQTGELRLCPESWLPAGTGHVELRRVLQPLLELDVQAVIVSHGEPVVDGAADALRSVLVVRPPVTSRRPRRP